VNLAQALMMIMMVMIMRIRRTTECHFFTHKSTVILSSDNSGHCTVCCVYNLYYQLLCGPYRTISRLCVCVCVFGWVSVWMITSNENYI